jgi:hypothetical protein
MTSLNHKGIDLDAYKKVCQQCRTEKLGIDFYVKPKKSKDGLMPKCKECVKANGRVRMATAAKIPLELREVPDKKICLACKVEKSSSEFHKHAQKKDGLCAICKECNKDKSNKWYVDNNEKDVQTRREYYNNNKESVLAQCKEYRNANIDKVLAYQREYYEINSEKVKSKVREYAKQNMSKHNKFNPETFDSSIPNCLQP